jgi:phage terminase large subunit GpA-like protein
MDDWERIIRKEIEAMEDVQKMQAHHNHNCGIPYRESAQKPDIVKVYELRGNYKSRQIPTGVLFLTCAIDVQLGSKVDKTKPPRLEIEVLGHGLGYRTWSILYKVIEGEIWNAYDGAWEELAGFASGGGLEFARNDGLVFSPVIVLADARDGKVADIVFDFCARWDNAYPIMGAKELKESKTGQKMSALLDEYHARKNADRFRLNKKNGMDYIVVASNLYKKSLYRSLKIERQEGEIQKARFCEFPSDYPDRYFEMLLAEEQRADGSFWKPSNRPNESLDLRMMNMCAGEFWLAIEVQRARAHAQRVSRMTKEEASYIQVRHILQKYIENTARRKITA